MYSNFIYKIWQTLLKTKTKQKNKKANKICTGKSILGVIFGCIVLCDIRGMEMREKEKPWA